jgi:hypothetical protein
VSSLCDAKEKLKLSSDCGDSDIKKFKQGYGGVWLSLFLAGVWSQAVGFLVMRLAGVWLQWKCFTFNLLYK